MRSQYKRFALKFISNQSITSSSYAMTSFYVCSSNGGFFVGVSSKIDTPDKLCPGTMWQTTY